MRRSRDRRSNNQLYICFILFIYSITSYARDHDLTTNGRTKVVVASPLNKYLVLTDGAYGSSTSLSDIYRIIQCSPSRMPFMFVLLFGASPASRTNTTSYARVYVASPHSLFNKANRILVALYCEATPHYVASPQLMQQIYILFANRFALYIFLFYSICILVLVASPLIINKNT